MRQKRRSQAITRKEFNELISIMRRVDRGVSFLVGRASKDLDAYIHCWEMLSGGKRNQVEEVWKYTQGVNGKGRASMNQACGFVWLRMKRVDGGFATRGALYAFCNRHRAEFL